MKKVLIKKVLVTGGSGLVGSAIKDISEYHLFDFIFVNSKDCNLLSFKECNDLFEKIKPTYVIHLAACVGGLYKNMSQKVKMLEDNLAINTNVLKCAKIHLVEKLIACLSTCVFPDKVSGKINESMLNDGPPHSSNEGYAYAKRILDCQCRLYNQMYGTNFICIIPTNIYGFNDNFNLEDSHVLPALIHKAYLAKRDNLPFVIKGSGKPLRQFIYSKDLAKLILLILSSRHNENTIILSPSEEYSIKTIADIIANIFEISKVHYDTTFSDGQYSKTVDNSKMFELFDFKFTPINEGILETIKWFKNNYNTLRK